MKWPEQRAGILVAQKGEVVIDTRNSEGGGKPADDQTTLGWCKGKTLLCVGCSCGVKGEATAYS